VVCKTAKRKNVIMHYTYSDTFAQTITGTYGAKGSQWLIQQLPELIEQCATEWQLTELKPYPHLTYNYVLSGMMQDKPIVLKLRCDYVAAIEEIAALKAFEGFGCISVLNSKPELGVLLLERAMPGKLLDVCFPHNDARATEIAVKCLQKLHKAPIPMLCNFPTLDQKLPHFTDEPQALMPFIDYARILRKRLIETHDKKVLLHGDFHHGNILSSGSQWVIIDPQSMIGDPLYDIAVYIRNPLSELIAGSAADIIIKTRIHTIAQLLGYDAQHIYDWTYLQAVISAYWSLEDNRDASRHVTFLNFLQQMKNNKQV
jgi:streptomycin 6-kinase